MPSKKLTAQKRAELERKKYKQQRSNGFPTLLILFIVIIVGVVGVYFVVSNLGNGDTNGGTPIVNTAPSAIDDYAVLAMNSEIQIIDPLTNDIDLDNDNLTITRITYPTHGYAEMVSGLIQYTPETNFSGVDSFDYTISDGENEATSKVHVIVTANTNPIALIDTTMGTIVVELYEDKVPITAGNFKDLANAGFYDETKFHRISPGFMIQSGDPNSKDDDPSDDGTGGPGYAIEDEFHDDLKNLRGMISMANSGPNTGGSQFFILVGDASWLDGAHAVFGKVLEGMDVVDNIANMDHDGRFDPNPGGGRPLTDVVVNSITIEND